MTGDVAILEGDEEARFEVRQARGCRQVSRDSKADKLVESTEAAG
jgi:hypothetical protein